jgi:hypothetical protein
LTYAQRCISHCNRAVTYCFTKQFYQAIDFQVKNFCLLLGQSVGKACLTLDWAGFTQAIHKVIHRYCGQDDGCFAGNGLAPISMKNFSFCPQVDDRKLNLHHAE